MIALVQTIVTVALGAILAGQVALTRTSRLRRTIAANLDLLDRLPAEHPNRAILEAHNGELLTVLARRQRSRFGPFIHAGASFGAVAVTAFYALVLAGFAALMATGTIPSNPDPDPTPADQWSAMWFLLVVTASFIVWAVVIVRRQLREHPLPPAPTKTPAPVGPAQADQA
jgi:hypothetical protein